MKRTAILGSLLLVLAMSAVVLAQQGSRTQTAPHEISGELDGTLTFVPLPALDPDAPPPPLLGVDTLGVASGTMKGLGLSNIFTLHRPVADAAGSVRDGHFWIIAADGDKIKGTYTGTTESVPNTNQLIGTGTWVITGGTGRFENADGTIQMTVYVTSLGFGVSEWPATWVLEGTINY